MSGFGNTGYFLQGWFLGGICLFLILKGVGVIVKPALTQV